MTADLEARHRVPWHKDVAFWVVMISFAVFLATGASIVWNLKTVYGGSRQSQIAESRKQAGLGADDQTGMAESPGAARIQTIDSRSFKKWVHIDLASGKIVHPLYVSSMDWDLGFKRYHVIANGGAANIAARGGIANLGPMKFNQANRIPEKGYVLDVQIPGGARGEVENKAISHWYNYDYSTHVLTPDGDVYIVRTPSQHYYKLQILNYYCKDMESGCLTFRYARLR